MTSSSPLYHLDTNIMIHAVRSSPTWQQIKVVCDPLMIEPRPQISVVSDGEIRSFARQQGWGTVRMEIARFLLNYFSRVSIDTEEIIENYGKIDAYSKQTGYTMGKNDIWIAATASTTGAVLVTTDGDFDHLDGVFLTRVRITPV